MNQQTSTDTTATRSDLEELLRDLETSAPGTRNRGGGTVGEDARARIDRLHEEVREAGEKVGRLVGGHAARKKLAAALEAELAALNEFGFETYGDYARATAEDAGPASPGWFTDVLDPALASRVVQLCGKVCTTYTEAIAVVRARLDESAATPAPAQAFVPVPAPVDDTPASVIAGVLSAPEPVAEPEPEPEFEAESEPEFEAATDEVDEIGEIDDEPETVAPYAEEYVPVAAAPAAPSVPDETLAQLEALEQELAAAQQAAADAEAARANASLQLVDVTVELDEMRRALEQARHDAKQAASALDTARQANESADAERAAMRAQLDQIQAELAETTTQHAALRSEFETLQQQHTTLQSSVGDASEILGEAAPWDEARIHQLFTPLHQAADVVAADIARAQMQTATWLGDITRRCREAEAARDAAVAEAERVRADADAHRERTHAEAAAHREQVFAEVQAHHDRIHAEAEAHKQRTEDEAAGLLARAHADAARVRREMTDAARASQEKLAALVASAGDVVAELER